MILLPFCFSDFLLNFSFLLQNTSFSTVPHLHVSLLKEMIFKSLLSSGIYRILYLIWTDDVIYSPFPLIMLTFTQTLLKFFLIECKVIFENGSSMWILRITAGWPWNWEVMIEKPRGRGMMMLQQSTMTLQIGHTVGKSSCFVWK